MYHPALILSSCVAKTGTMPGTTGPDCRRVAHVLRRLILGAVPFTVFLMVMSSIIIDVAQAILDPRVLSWYSRLENEKGAWQ